MGHHEAARCVVAVAQAVNAAAGFCSLLRCSCILEPVHHVVDVQRLAATPRFQRVQLHHVGLNLLARGMRVFLEPTLQLRQLHFRIEAGAHSCLLIGILRVHGLQCRMNQHARMRLMMVLDERLSRLLHVVDVWCCKIELCCRRLLVNERQYLVSNGIGLRRQLTRPPLVKFPTQLLIDLGKGKVVLQRTAADL
jgi:hypothetical protein